jgi:hypothetical protein
VSKNSQILCNAKYFFNVRVQDLNSLERTTLAYFNDKEDANLFVRGKYSNINKTEGLDTFMIFKDQVLIATLTKNVLDNQSLRDIFSSETFKGATLSPLSTRPTPPGGPADYWKESREFDDENID